METISDFNKSLKIRLTKIIGDNIYKYRTESGLTQEELAEKAGIGASFVARIESGQKIMSVPVLYGLAKALHVSVDMLLSEKTDTTTLEKLTVLMKDCSQEEINNVERLLRLSLSIIESDS